MSHDDRARPIPQRLLDASRIKLTSSGVDVDINRKRINRMASGGGVTTSIRDGDYFITGTHTQRTQRKFQRIGAVSETNAVWDATVNRKITFERIYSGSSYKNAVIEKHFPGRKQLAPASSEATAYVIKGDCH